MNRRSFITKMLFSTAALPMIHVHKLFKAVKPPGFTRAGKIKKYPGRIKRLSLTQVRKMGIWSG